MSLPLVLQPLGLAASRLGAANSGTGHPWAACLAAGVLSLGLALAPVEAASALLESVKQNPQLSKQLCAEFKQLNAQGQSATSPQSLARVASSQGLSTMDAEVLTTYVIGLYCPDVR
jgi:hypothetical protein